MPPCQRLQGDRGGAFHYRVDAADSANQARDARRNPGFPTNEAPQAVVLPSDLRASHCSVLTPARLGDLAELLGRASGCSVDRLRFAAYPFFFRPAAETYLHQRSPRQVAIVSSALRQISRWIGRKQPRSPAARSTQHISVLRMLPGVETEPIETLIERSRAVAWCCQQASHPASSWLLGELMQAWANRP